MVQQNWGLRPVAPFLHQTSQKRSPSREREGLLPSGLCFAVFIPLLPLDGSVFAVPSFQLHPVFSAVSNRMPSGNAMLRFVGFGDKSWDNFKNFFQTQDVEFLFLSQRPRLAAFGGSIAPKMPVLKLSRPLACKPPVAIVSESARVACASCAKPQLTGLRHRRSKGVVSGGLPMSRR